MTDTRTDPPAQGDERSTLTSFLDYHRETLIWKCEGLTESQLRERSVPPSSLSLLGLVRHLTEVERSWFRRVLINEEAPPIYYTDADPDGDFDHLDSTPVDEVFAAWRAEVDRAREIVADVDSLETVAKAARREPPVSLRWILAHMIEFSTRGTTGTLICSGNGSTGRPASSPLGNDHGRVVIGWCASLIGPAHPPRAWVP